MWSKMKKVFWILGVTALLLSSSLSSFVNGTSCRFISQYGFTNDGCYIIKHIYKPDSSCWPSYSYSELVAYKCDTEWWIVDLRDAPLEDGQYIASIWENAFSWTNVTKVIIPNTVKYIWDWAFCSAEREWEPTCWNEVIELWEECDDWSSWSDYCTSVCEKTLCWNWVVDEWESCFTCSEDIERNGWSCWKSVWKWGLDEEYLSSLEPEIQLKWQVTSEAWPSQLPFVDRSKFVEVDFPDGMNEEFIVSDLGYSCAKFHEYKVTFKTETGTIMVETEYQYINPVDVPSLPDREWFIWGWYLWAELFDINQLITKDITLEYKYVKWWVEYDEENGWIRVKLWDQEIIVKDKDQWAEKSFKEVDSQQYDDLINSVWNYYFWWNNAWLDSIQIFDEDGELKDIESFPEWFDHGYLWLEWWNDWTVWSNDTPCDANKWEYLPSPDDWKELMFLWWKINWYNLYNYEMWYFFDDMGIVYPDTWKWGKSLNVFLMDNPGFDDNESIENPGNVWFLSAIVKFLNDLYVWWTPSLYIDDWWIDFANKPIFFPSSLSEWKVWYLGYDWLYLLDTNLSWFVNNLVTPVRCFVKPIKQGEEKVETPKQSMSGWWGRWSASKISDATDKTHNSAEDKVDSSSEETVKTNQDNKVDNIQGEIKEKSSDATQKKVTYIPNRSLPEMEQAYDFASSYWITTKTSVQNAKMNGPLTRIAMAKMLSNYAINVMWKQPDVSKWVIKFNDVTKKMDKDYNNAVTLAYQLWIMWQNMPNNNFRPNDEVTRAQFVTALSRLLYWTSDWEYESTSKYYVNHMEKLKKEWIITKDNPTMKERRWYVMLMLMRSVK